MNNESKLPQWTQTLLLRLRQEVESMTEKIRVANGQPGVSTNISLKDFLDNNKTVYLPEHTPIRFSFASGQGGWPLYIDVQMSNDGEFIIVRGGSFGSLALCPWASNVVHIRVGR